MLNQINIELIKNLNSLDHNHKLMKKIMQYNEKH